MNINTLQESMLEHKFLEASAINKHRLQSLDYALNLLNQVMHFTFG